METLKPYIGSYMDSSVFLNNGKYGWYLNHDKKLYGVPQCFQKPTFKLDDAIKIIEYKKKMKEQLNKEPKGVSEDVDEIIKKVKSKKKVLN